MARMRLLSRFGLATLVGLFVGCLIASASYGLGLWLGRNSDNLRWIIYGSVPFALLLGVAACMQPRREAQQKGDTIVALLVGTALGFLYALVVAKYAFAYPAFLALMLSCWIPSGISAMVVAVRGKEASVVIGIAILCVTAIVFTEPVFNAVTHNQQMTVAFIAPSEMAPAQLEAWPDASGFDNDNEIRTAKNDVLQRIRALGYTETFCVLSINRLGKGKKSLAIVVVRGPITKEAVLPVPDRSSVVYSQQSDNWSKNPAQTPVLARRITMTPPGMFEIPDAQGLSLVGEIRVRTPTRRR
jgi:hypothetical protein